MAIKQFDSLTETEAILLYQAPAVVTVLIAGADSTIDEEETEWASKLVNYRTFTSDPLLHEYYEHVEAQFEGNIAHLVSNWSPENGTQALSERLASALPVLDKLDEEFAALLKKSWRSLAKKVAEASGGLLGFGSIGAAEKALISLPMLGE